ncbi:hypothetical protein PHYSODRAFT_324364 [Phytophthora sojae]|uniref:Uncharacterized protein n=1 Tax=Phytophthora sojae (strain P6497) TaxID=1094619 RepID=G4YU31_PHYSP|nr:hypothetical protein PHYSODRAFT_324364 [Phytophthora sojae]EGZ23109.1 hypothetical protein PHYSODRAFT_324364 [Phytophthora sojae]|eukprot:XP_009518397.1 hypothetical protein PHYSODRAFT_324364 [Phytophthora sojae]
MSSPQKKTAAATEGNLSVAQYRERQQAKRDALAAKAASETTQSEIVLEGSSVVNDAVDYEDDDVEMEVGEVSSSKRMESIDSDSLDPHAGSRRPREGDDSDASSSKRSRGESETPLSAAGPRAARDPWMPSASEIADRVGNTVPPNDIPLYVCSGIHDDAVAEEQHFDPLTNQRRDYYIGLFHELRYFSSKKTSSRSKNFNKKPAAYCERVKYARERFETFSTRGRLEHLHRSSGDAGIPCAVPEGHQCTLCLPGAARLSDRDLNGYTTIRVPASLKDLRAKFLAREERDDRGTSGACVVNFVRPHHFRNVLQQDVPWLPCMLVGRKPSPTNTITNRLRAAVVGTRPGYGQPGVDLGPTLEERVAAVEQLQNRMFAALKQEVAILRAQVAQGSQTASDISADVGGRVVRLAQRVHALEQRFAPAGASASGQPS